MDEDDFATGLVVDKVQWMGYTKVILKADNERALQKLVVAALKRLRLEVPEIEQATKEQPQTYHSQSNGGTEVGIKNLRKDYRTSGCASSRGWSARSR